MKRSSLRRDRGHHLRVAVAGVEHGDAAGEIDIAPALDVPDLGILRAGGIDGRRMPDAARDGGVAAGEQVGVGGHRLASIVRCSSGAARLPVGRESDGSGCDDGALSWPRHGRARPRRTRRTGGATRGSPAPAIPGATARASAKPLAPRTLTASTVPSSAMASTARRSASRSIPWPCSELTSIRSAPSNSAAGAARRQRDGMGEAVAFGPRDLVLSERWSNRPGSSWTC